MLPVRPNEDLPIVRKIDNPFDTTTYYVQAVIKNARTLATLATVNLTDNGDRLFSYNWWTPADAVGLGMYIIITTTVYTDAGYTTKSDVYAEQTETYKIELNQAHFGGGGGADVDYARVRKIIQEELGKVPQIEIPKFPEMPIPEKLDLMPVLKAIAEKTFPISEQKKVDLSGLVAGQQQILKVITEIPQPDMAPMMDEMKKIMKTLEVLAGFKTILEKDLNILEDLKKASIALEEAIKKASFVSVMSPYITSNVPVYKKR